MVASAIQTYTPANAAIAVSASKRFAPRSIFDLNQDQFGRLQMICKAVSGSQLSYAKMGNKVLTDQDVMILMLKGMSLGFSEMTALEMIDLISGKPALKPQGMMALIYDSGELEYIKFDDDGTTAIVTAKRKGMPEHIERFSMEDADRLMTKEWINGQSKDIPLSQKSNWKAQPKVMRMWRCIAAMARKVFSDIIQGMYPPEELNPDLIVDADGNVIEDRSPSDVVISQVPPPQLSDSQQHQNQGNYPASKQTSAAPAQAQTAPSAPAKSTQAAAPVTEVTPGDAPKGWATHDSLSKLLGYVRPKTVENMTILEMARLAGINPPSDVDGWNQKYPTGRAAGEVIVSAFEHEMTSAPLPTEEPNKPAWDDAKRTKFIHHLENMYKLSLVEGLALMGIQSLDQTAGYEDACDMAAIAASEQLIPVMVTHAKYVTPDKGNSFTTLDIIEEGVGRHIIPLRLYNSTEVFGKMGWDGWTETVLKKNPGKYVSLPVVAQVKEWAWGEKKNYATVKELVKNDVPF